MQIAELRIRLEQCGEFLDVGVGIPDLIQALCECRRAIRESRRRVRWAECAPLDVLIALIERMRSDCGRLPLGIIGNDGPMACNDDALGRLLAVFMQTIEIDVVTNATG